MNAEQVFDPFLPKLIPFHVRGKSIKDNGLIVDIDYVTEAVNGFVAAEKAKTDGLCRVVVSEIKSVAS